MRNPDDRDQELPNELAEIELLLRQSNSPPPSGLRQRVLGAVRSELKKRPSFRISRLKTWEFAAVAALVFLCFCNLSMGAANRTEWKLNANCDTCDTAEVERQVRQLFPELQDDPAFVRACVFQCCSPRTAAPAVSRRPSVINWKNFDFTESEATWDLH